MEILATLGVNSTVLIQFAIFCIVYFFLMVFLFTPYFKAYVERKKRTVGSHDTAERLIEEARGLQTQYETRARELNQNYKAIFDETRTHALRQHDQMVAEARQNAKGLLDQTKLKISVEIERAQLQVQKQIPEVSMVIETKLLGKTGEASSL